MKRFINSIIIILLGSMLSAQDDCNSAIDLNNELGPFAFCTTYVGQYSTDGFSPEPDLAALNCEYENFPTMWFVINPPAGATSMNISATGNSQPTLGVFIENGCNPPYDQAAPFSGCNFDPTEIDLLVTDALSYYIVVSTQSGNGSFNLKINFDNGSTFPANDLCANAIEVFDEVPLLDQDNFCATYDNSLTCDNESTVWYFIEIPEDSYQILVILTPGTAVLPSITIYDDCGGNEIANALGCLPVQLTGCLPAGIYYIEVATTVWNEGTFDIEVNIEQCLPPCEITEPNFDDITCNDNGTTDPSDDFITFTLDPEGNGLGAGYDISTSLPEGISPTSASYGGPTTFSLDPGSANCSGDFSITLTDQANANCSFTFMASCTGPCSPECMIEDTGLTNVECNDSGTAFNPTDDYIQFELSPTGSNLATMYNVTVAGGNLILPTTGLYNVETTFFLQAGSAGGGDVMVIISDVDDPGCTFEFTIPDPGTCSDACEILNVEFTNVVCNDNDTPTDPSDDYISYVVFVQGSNTGSAYSMIADGTTAIISTGLYDINSDGLLELGSALLGEIQITFFDIDDPGCQFVATLPNPGSCSDLCEIIEANLEDFQCRNNDTENDSSDDFYTFTLNPSGSNLGVTYAISGNGVMISPASGIYGSPTEFFTPLGSAGNGDITITITDDNNTSCEIDVQLSDLGSCSSDCKIDSIVLLSAICNDNSTPSDSIDDFLTVEFTTFGSNTSDSVSVEIIGFLDIDTFAIIDTHSIELPFNSTIPDTIDIIVSDLEQGFCKDTLTIPNHGPCSLECIVDSLQIINAFCNDNETNTPDDDFIEIEFVVLGKNVSSSFAYSVMSFPDGVADYGDTISITSTASIIGISQFILTIEDIIDPLCINNFPIENPGPCSTDCAIVSSNFDNVICNDAATNTDDSDDFISFEIIVQANNPGSSYSILINNGLYTYSNLDYDIVNFINLPAGSALDGDYSIEIIDDDLEECMAMYTLDNPGSCSTTCTILPPSISNILCNDNGTLSDPSDDYITFMLDATGSNTSSGYQITSDIGDVSPNSGNYGIAESFSLDFGSAGGGNILLTIVDNDDSSCFAMVELNDPGSCSDECAILSSSFDNVICHDSATSSDNSDDFISFEVIVEANNSGSSYSILINNGLYTYSNLDYDIVNFINLPAGSALDGNYSIEIIDDDLEECMAMYTLDNPGPCSTTCNLFPPSISNILCNDNGTLFDPSDDYISFDLMVSGDNIGSSFSLNNAGSTIVPMTGEYNEIIAFELPAGSAGNGNVEIIIIDALDSLCTLSFTVVDPGDCSSECNFTVDAGADIELNCNTPMVERSAQHEGFPSIEWIDSDGEILSNNAEIQFNEGGSYFVSFDYGNGCVLRDSIEVFTNFEAPIFELGNDTVLDCAVQLIEFNAPLSSGNYSYFWYETEILVSEETTYQSENPSILKLTIQNEENGCSYADSLLITIDTITPNAVIYADPLTQIDCIIQTVTLTTESEENVIYQWSYDDEIVIADEITVVKSTEVNLLAIDTLNGCSDFDNILIENNIEYPFISLSSEEIICDQEEITINAEGSQTGPFISAQWTGADGMLLSGNEYTLSISEPGLYIFTLMDSANGCINSDSIVIEAISIPFPEYSINQFSISDGSVQLEIVSDNDLVGNWIVDGQAICTECQEIILSGDSNVSLEVIIMDSLGCIQTQQLMIEFEPEQGIYFPNVFSPNGDGINDIFEIFGPADTQVVSFTIYDRWGNLMHLVEDKTLGDTDIFWDGFYNGKLVQSGVYVYCFTTLETNVCGTITVVQ
ncbi:MAG: T9SS type B sorting domain-containing protein [Bacteroidota bacterium]